MSLKRLLKQSITINNPAGALGKHGEVVLGASATVPCRFEKTSRTILNPQGEREPIDGVAYVGATAVLQLGAKVIYSTETYRLMRIEEIPGRRGIIHHYELLLQLWSFA